ncbi:MAG TPA: ABC transporter substrate-binding protein [Methylomusa anaerophila]|uniref:NMT1/THI5 like protein n=1 Tax=Methylomusa anaerophila TaxID=1930071 RepID=A0A348AEL6_9FIRM|nr:ABC transporter substrate-binding protein [Methylomusa anaerophila]BBB89514.1 NMT1/THI5 like protein [Methylomusa anaerophila]HML90116.1 ABC transporter substrate-binding protein [Methylomusa anaerophila]
MTDKKRNIKLAIVGVVVLAVLVAVGFGARKGTVQLSSSDKKDLIEIRVPTYKTCASTAWVVADKKGFLEKEGLKLVYTGELIATQILPSVLNGNNDIGTAQPNMLAIAKAGGAAVTAVARQQIEPPANVDPVFRHMRFYANPASGIKSIADLKNYKPGQQIKTDGTTNSCNQFLFNTLLDKAGVPRDRFEWVTFTNDIAVIQSTSQGILDVAQVHPPYYKSAEDAGLVLIADSTDTGLGESAGSSLYYFKDDFIKNNPETVKKFVRAIVAAQKWSDENPQEAVKLTADWINVPVTGVHYFATTSEIKESDLTPWIKDLENSGGLTPGQLKPSDLITREFENVAVQ